MKEFCSAEEFFGGMDDDMYGGGNAPPVQSRPSSAKFAKLKIRVAMRARGISRAEATVLVESLSEKKADCEEEDCDDD